MVEDFSTCNQRFLYHVFSSFIANGVEDGQNRKMWPQSQIVINIMIVKVDERAILHTIFTASEHVTSHDLFFLPKPSAFDLQATATKLAFRLKGGMSTVMDEEIHDLIYDLPDIALSQPVFGKHALIYISGNFGYDIFWHFFYRHRLIYPDVYDCPMMVLEKSYELTDSHQIPRYLFDVACDKFGVDRIASLCHAVVNDPVTLAIMLEETHIPRHYQKTFRFLLAMKIKRMNEKCEDEGHR